LNVSSEHAAPAKERLRFTGSGSEYFRVWVVNVALTVVTLGLYAAWAKVRTRRYFYRNTLLAGQPFEYLADPWALLRGNLIVAGAFVAYTLTQQWKPLLAGFVGTLGYALLPYLVWKSLRFHAHNSSHRNLRFRFRGTLGESYRVWLLLPSLIPLTLGLLLPYWHFRRKKFTVDNFTYGKTYFYFDGAPRAFYGVYLRAGLLALGLPVLAGTVVVLYALLLRAAPQDPTAAPPAWFIGAAVVAWAGGALLVALIQQVLVAGITNYTWRYTRAGPLRFESALAVWPLFWIAVTNTAATVATLGLLYPWAKVRRTRYLLQSLTVISAEALDGFAAASEPEASALGDAAVDFLDFEIGL